MYHKQAPTMCTMDAHTPNGIVTCQIGCPLSLYLQSNSALDISGTYSQNPDCPCKLREGSLACFLQINVFPKPCSAHTNGPSQAGQVWPVRGNRRR